MEPKIIRNEVNSFSPVWEPRPLNSARPPTIRCLKLMKRESDPQLGISIGVRSGLTGLVGVLSRQVVRHNVTINGLLPGRFETDRLRESLAFAAKVAGHSTEDEAVLARGTIPAARFGKPEEFGAFAAFLCSTHAGYLTGQNIVLDGGAYPGLL